MSPWDKFTSSPPEKQSGSHWVALGRQLMSPRNTSLPPSPEGEPWPRRHIASGSVLRSSLQPWPEVRGKLQPWLVQLPVAGPQRIVPLAVMPLVLTSSSALALLSFPTCSSSWRVPWLWVFFRPAPLESRRLLSFDLRPYLVFFFTCLFLFWLLCLAVVLRRMPILFPCTRSLPAGCCPQQRWTTVLWFTSKAPGLRSLRLGLSRRQEESQSPPASRPDSDESSWESPLMNLAADSTASSATARTPWFNHFLRKRSPRYEQPRHQLSPSHPRLPLHLTPIFEPKPHTSQKQETSS